MILLLECFFNWNVSCSCIFITMHACLVHIMIWNPDDDRWQELLGRLVSIKERNNTLGPRHKSWRSQLTLQSRTSNLNSEHGSLVKWKGMWSTPGILPHPPKKLVNETIHPKFTRFDSMMLRDHMDSGLKTRWVSRFIAPLRFAYNPSARHIHFWWGDVCIVNGHSEHDQTWHQRQILCWWFRHPANSPVDMVNTSPVVWDFFDQQYYRFALSFNSAIEKIIYFFCWSCEINKLPSMCC